MKYYLSCIVGILMALNLASVTLAQSPPGGGGTGSPPGAESVTIDNPIEADNIQELFQAIIDIVLVFAIPIIVFFIIYAGFLYVTARGNPSTIEQAHKALLYALIGGLLIIGARVLIEVVEGTVNAIAN